MTTTVGVIGAGMMGAIHARAWRSHEDVNLSRVYDATADRASRLAGELETEVAGSVEELLDAVDIVSICTPPASHVGIVTAAAQAGVHVLLEKPSARTLAEHDRIADVVKAAGVTAMVGVTGRFYPETRAAKKYLREHPAGAILGIVERVYMDDAGLPAWYHDPTVAGGGVLLTNGIHSVDRVLWLTDTTQPTLEQVRLLPRARSERYAEAVVGLRDGARAHLQLVWQAGAFGESVLDIVREGDTVRVTNWQGLRVSGAEPIDERYYRSDMTFDDRTAVGVAEETRVLLAAVERGASPESGLDDHRRALALIEEAFRREGAGDPDA